MSQKLNHQWRLAKRPSGLVQPTDFEWREAPVPPIGDGQVLVRTVYLSLDPTNRIWMNEEDSYLPALAIGALMRGGGVGLVEESRNSRFAAGDIVQGLFGW